MLSLSDTITVLPKGIISLLTIRGAPAACSLTVVIESTLSVKPQQAYSYIIHVAQD